MKNLQHRNSHPCIYPPFFYWSNRYCFCVHVISGLADNNVKTARLIRCTVWLKSDRDLSLDDFQQTGWRRKRGTVWTFGVLTTVPRVKYNTLKYIDVVLFKRNIIILFELWYIPKILEHNLCLACVPLSEHWKLSSFVHYYFNILECLCNLNLKYLVCLNDIENILCAFVYILCAFVYILCALMTLKIPCVLWTFLVCFFQICN